MAGILHLPEEICSGDDERKVRRFKSVSLLAFDQ